MSMVGEFEDAYALVSLIDTSESFYGVVHIHPQQFVGLCRSEGK